jgi:hypothetical protein
MAKSISRRLADSASPTGAIDGTLSTAAQTNITSVGTLSSLVIADGATIGSASDTNSITISSAGVVTLDQIPVFSAGINVSGGSIAGTLSTAAQTNITSVGTLSALDVSGTSTLAGNVGIGTTSPNSYSGYTALTLNHATNGGLLDFELNGNLQGEIYANSANLGLGLQAVGNRSIEFQTNGTVRATMDGSGNFGIGIGTSSASAKLHLKTSNNAYSGGFRIEGTDETTALAITHVNGDNYFSGNGTDDHLVLTGSGSLLVGGASLNAASSVGFTTAGQIRQVFASGVANDSIFGAISGVSNGFQIIQDTSNNQKYIFHNGGAASVTIDSSGHVGIGVTAPDAHFHANSGAGGPGVKLETSSGQFTVQGSDAGGTYIEQTGTTAATRKFRLQNQDGSNNYTQVIIDGSNRRVEVIPALDVHQGAVWNTTTPGTAKGTIHLDPAITTDHAGSSITFGASDTGNGQNGQAGIYTASDGSYGTKMYLATTNNYTAGSKVSLSIDHLGNVSVPRGYITSLQPAFRANYTGNAWSASGNTIFPHNTTTFNNGGHYSTTNYRFTAPNSGLYSFHFHTIYYGSGTNAAVSFRKNGVGIEGTNTHFSSNNGAVWQTVNITTNVVLADNDYVEVFVNSMGGLTYLHGGVWNEFSGYLVG